MPTILLEGDSHQITSCGIIRSWASEQRHRKCNKRTNDVVILRLGVAATARRPVEINKARLIQ